ncbi:unnamed protein product [Arctia plantaginis]|uniref:Integrase zinc-binding domain-containing protein n=1 Tax=Arctia plantaginis TaxID=874455 RepID=A0A8S0ZI23_ARCPL|nr:unnamed protein product [Arctia plantaginis]
MEAKLQKQQILSESIRKISSNFKKDSAKRKTAAYISERLEVVEELWTQFDLNNTILSTSTERKTDDYFISKAYEKVKQEYETIRGLLQNWQVSSTEDKGIPSNTDELINQQSTNFRAFMRIIKNINISDIKEKWEIEDKLEMLQARWKIIDKLHWQIDNLLVGTNVSYEEEYTKHETLFEATKRELNTALNISKHRDDISRLKNNKPLRSTSNILSLNPILDECGILKVGGRLTHSNLSDRRKHPIILASSHRLTELLIDQAHKQTLHGGARLTLAHLRNRYWVIGGMRTVKKQNLQNTVNINRDAQYIPESGINQIINTSVFTFEPENHLQQLSYLKEKLELVKNQQEALKERAETHDKHHYVVYAILALGGTILGACCILKFKVRFISNRQSSVEPEGNPGSTADLKGRTAGRSSAQEHASVDRESSPFTSRRN